METVASELFWGLDTTLVQSALHNAAAGVSEELTDNHPEIYGMDPIALEYLINVQLIPAFPHKLGNAWAEFANSCLWDLSVMFEVEDHPRVEFFGWSEMHPVWETALGIMWCDSVALDWMLNLTRVSERFQTSVYSVISDRKLNYRHLHLPLDEQPPALHAALFDAAILHSVSHVGGWDRKHWKGRRTLPESFAEDVVHEVAMDVTNEIAGGLGAPAHTWGAPC